MGIQASAICDEQPLYSERSTPPFFPVLVIVFPILPFFRTYSVEIYTDRLIFGYSSGMTRKVVERSQVLSAEPIDHVNGLYSWGGWGIRKNLKWETGYIARNGPAVRIKTTDNQTYVFNAKDPKRVCDILNT